MVQLEVVGQIAVVSRSVVSHCGLYSGLRQCGSAFGAADFHTVRLRTGQALKPVLKQCGSSVARMIPP